MLYKNPTVLTNEKLIKILTDASEAYYNTDNILISDSEFDSLELEYQKRFNKKFIGALPNISKGTINVSHKFNSLVGTLSKCKNINDIRDWMSDTVKKLEINYVPSFIITLKYDGNSIVIEYSNGKVVKVLTRGKDGKGLDLTHVFKNYHELEYLKNNCGIKYEVVMKYTDFNKLMEDENLEYANPRSVVAGKLGCDDAIEYSDYFTLIPLWLKDESEDISRSKQIQLLTKEFGSDYIDDVLHYTYEIENCSTIDEVINDIEEIYNDIINIRSNLPFMIDGLVIEYKDEELRNKLGMNTGFPNWATALKFPYLEKESTVVDFDYCLGDSSRITPRVWFEPVDFNGTKHRKQSLQNYARYKELNLKVGDKILVSYNNDCLSYIERLGERDTKDNTVEIKCPVCGSIGIPNETNSFIYCNNPLCSGKLTGKLQNYLTKMNIKGLKENMLNILIENNILKSIPDLYNIEIKDVEGIKGLGTKTAINIKTSIESKIPYDYEILGSLGIPNCSRTTSKDICKEYPLNELIKLYNTNDEETFISILVKLNGIGLITASYIVEGIKNNIETIEYLLNRKYLVYKDSISNNTNGLTIVFTGFRDKDMQLQLEQQGHKISSSISKKTNILVTPNPNANSSKITKAKDLGIEIITVEECKTKFKI